MGKRFQFSIRSMLAATAVVGLSLGAIVGKRGMVSGSLLLLMLTAIPATAIVGIIHSGGYRRSFFIGLFVSSSLGLVVVGYFLLNAIKGTQSVPRVLLRFSMSSHRTQATLIWSLALATGVSCVVARWFLGTKGGGRIITMRFQFSIRWIFAVTMAVAGAAGLWVATPSWQLGVIELVLIFFVPAFSAVASQNSTGYAKAFWVGVLVSTVLGSLFLFVVLFPTGNWGIVKFNLDNSPKPELAVMSFFSVFAGFGRFMVVFWSFGPLVGILCVLGHWLVGKKE